MRSRTSCFNSAVIRKTISRFWPLWAVYAVVWLMLLPLSVLNTIQRGQTAILDNTLLSMAQVASPIMAFIFALLGVMAGFHWLYNSKSAGFYTTLPVRRESMFLSCFAAPLIMLLAGNVLAFLAGLLTLLPTGAAHLGALAQWLAVTCLDTLSFYGFAALCAMLTGSLLILPLVYVILQFTAVALEELLGSVYSHFVFGAADNGWQGTVTWLSPIYYRLSRTYVANDLAPGTDVVPGQVIHYFFHGWGIVLGYAAAGAVLALCAFLLFRRRRMETASDVVAIRVLKPVFRVCLALAAALGLAIVLYFGILGGGSNIGDLPHMLLFLFFMLLGGFIGWFAADMLIHKTFRVFRLHWRGWLVFSAALCLVSLAFELDLFGTEKRLPPEDGYEQVQIMSYGEYVTLEGDEALAAVRALHENIVAHKAVHEADNYEPHRAVWISYYRSDNDRTPVMARCWQIAAGEAQQQNNASDLRALERIFNLPEAVAARKDMGFELKETSIMNAWLEVRWTPVYEASTAHGGYYPGYYATSGDAQPVFITEDRQQEVILTQAEAWELYSQCILPDMAEGTLGRVWLVEDEDFRRTIYNLTINISFGHPDPDGKGWSGRSFYTVPTVDSRRTDAWLLEHGILLQTYQEAMEAAGAEASALTPTKQW